MIPQITASVFHRFLETGRTSPALFSHEGSTGLEGDYVVKLRGGMERPAAPLCELYASLLATHLGLAVPAPAILIIGEDLAELIAESSTDPVQANVVRNSIGWNFGSRFIPNLSSWPVDKKVSAAMREAAVRVFAFDALIQNPDRRFDNPNLGTLGNEIIIFDHESAFSFLLAIFASTEPWKLNTEGYLDDHVFARCLRHERLSIDFAERLANLSQAALAGIAAQVPEGWKADDLPKIEAHLQLMREHVAEFADEVGRRLR
jgi:hypothetical protein